MDDDTQETKLYALEKYAATEMLSYRNVPNQGSRPTNAHNQFRSNERTLWFVRMLHIGAVTEASYQEYHEIDIFVAHCSRTSVKEVKKKWGREVY